ncbi:MAG: hypothetical protein MJ119_01400 [Lachnospiraceae bacterium]|nr:hypothetical protein [Lachnospiraceae bacterium]
MRKVINWIVTSVFVIAMIIFCFLTKCKIDLLMLIASFVVALAAIVASVIQEKKIKDAEQQGLSLEDVDRA